jgi:hypothetical protein
VSKISTSWGSDTIAVEANWAQAAEQIKGDLEGGYVVGDFAHRPLAALRKALEQCASAEGMTRGESEPLIDLALERAVEA